MPELLLELLSEEIPARMQARAAADLERLVTDGLVEAGLVYEQARSFATPRRLALAVDGLAPRQPDVREERKGPRVGAPDKAIAGFLRGAGLDSLDQCEIRSDRKGDYHVAVIERPGRPTPDVIAEIVPETMRRFPWPRSMRWGEGSLRWVRPLLSIVCTFGASNEDPDVVSFEIDGIKSGDRTRGHRFMAGAPFRVRRLDDYQAKLEKARVILDGERRKEIILADARNLAFAQGLELVEDEALLAEVAGLVEWPVALMGGFDEAYLELPPEVLATSMKAHQKCFSVRRPDDGKLANRFIAVANLEAADGGRAITQGNERVIAARLVDARFFWEQDLKVPLEERVRALDGVIFHDRLGTQGERVARLKALARQLAPIVGADPDEAERAAGLCKADLATEMVGEFPELQGVMGRCYAERQREKKAVARAIEQHYRPQGPADAVPDEPVAVAVALADKLDMLTGFWAIDEKPTGSKDPYALRRAALGVIRIILENALRIKLNDLMSSAARAHYSGPAMRSKSGRDTVGVRQGVLDFFADRLKVHLRDKGARHDLIDAVFALGGQDDLLMIVRRVEALGRFLDTDDGANLLAGVERATSIIRIEEKKDGRRYDVEPDPKLLRQTEEKALYEAVGAAMGEAAAAIDVEDYEDAMRALSKLRAPVDAFFDKVTVNAEDPDLRENRLKLLSQIRAATEKVADFSKIEG